MRAARTARTASHRSGPQASGLGPAGDAKVTTHQQCCLERDSVWDIGA